MRLPIHIDARERGFSEVDVVIGTPASLTERGGNSYPGTVTAITRIAGEITMITVRRERNVRKHLAVVDPNAEQIVFVRQADGRFREQNTKRGDGLGLALGIRDAYLV